MPQSTHDVAMTKLALAWAIEDQDHVKSSQLATAIAREELRAHSLMGSQRVFQKLATANEVSGWGYAYEGGEFLRAAI